MSLTGNGSKSIRRKDVQEQKSIAVGLKKLVMAHKATLGDTGINLTSLNNPTEMSSLGFTNPLSSEILGANLKFYRNNLRIVSSHKGLLMDYLSYTVDSGSRITFQGFTAEDGEIFMMTFEDAAKTGVQMVDAAPLTSTGTLAVGVTDYNVGTPFEVNKYPTSQVGSVLVFRNGIIQFRNPNNGTSGGNYQEVQAGSGLGVIIRFNNAPIGIADNILVVSNGLLVYRPDGSLMAEIETLAGQLDVHREILEDVTGLPIAPGAPNNVDLKAFGDMVLALIDREIPYVSEWSAYTPSFNGFGSVSAVDVEWRQNGDCLEMRGRFTSGSTTGVEARISFPNSLISKVQSSALLPAGVYYRNNAGGVATAKGGLLLIESSVGYVTFSSPDVFSTTNANWDAKINASAGLAVNDEIAFEFKVKIDGWVASKTVREQLGL